MEHIRETIMAVAPDFEPMLVQDGFWATGMTLVSP